MSLPSQLRIKVKNLTFNNMPELVSPTVQKREAQKFFVLISFNGENFVTAKKSVDQTTNSIDFAQFSAE